jgi:glycosyltransferase involved in cell wall biosynthesis
VKILFVTSRLDCGGVERQLTLLVQGVRDAGCFPVIASVGNLGEAAETLTVPAVSVHNFPGHGHDPRLLPWLWQVIAETKPDLIHTWDGRANLFGVAAALAFPGIPLVATAKRHDRMGWPWRRRLDRLLDLRISRWVISSPAAAAMRQLCGVASERLTVIEPAVEIPDLLPDSPGDLRRSLNLPDEAPLIVAVGRFTADYAFRDALWAFDILKYVQPRAVLAVLGDGPDRAKLERFAADIRLGDQVRFLDRVSHGEPWLLAADVVWVPNLAEELPDALLQAMALGRPIIALRGPAVEAVMEEGRHAVLTPRGDQPALAQATQRLLADRETARRLASAARQRASERFSPQKMIDNYLTLYRSLAGAEKTGPGLARTVRLSTPHLERTA